MLEHFYDSSQQLQALRNGPCGSLIEGFACELSRLGYCKVTGWNHIRAAEHFTRWTDKECIASADFNEQVLERFYKHLEHCRCVYGYGRNNRRLMHYVRSFVGWVCGTGIQVRHTRAAVLPSLLAQFHDWMRQQRGTSEQTLKNYSISLRDLLNRIDEDPSRLNARILRDYVLEQSQHCGSSIVQRCTAAVRMFLRFLIAEGKCAPGLDAAVPTVASWRLAPLPHYLLPEEVERIIASCNPNSAVGKRDRAILLLLARLALRGGEVAQLRLGDIDWKRASISVSGKGGRQTQLPLTQELGQAIVIYLKEGRPQSHSDAVFVRCCAPYCSFANQVAISTIVKRAMRRAGVASSSRGTAHLLRHSAATSMLRQGGSLQEIAVILRHRSIETTQIYAKVDVAALRRIAQPWPEVQSC